MTSQSYIQCMYMYCYLSSSCIITLALLCSAIILKRAEVCLNIHSFMCMLACYCVLKQPARCLSWPGLAWPGLPCPGLPWPALPPLFGDCSKFWKSKFGRGCCVGFLEGCLATVYQQALPLGPEQSHTTIFGQAGTKIILCLEN